MMGVDNKKDTLFCGVNKDKILSAKPELNSAVVQEWFFHQKERTEIYYKKEILKSLPPWTQDPILSKYKFVNTKRTWDRQTKWLLKNIIHNTHLSYENKILNCILFRCINKGETLDLIGGAIDFAVLCVSDINGYMKARFDEKHKQDPAYVFFSAAYILGGPKVNFGKSIESIEGSKEENMVIRMIKFLYYNQDKLLTGIIIANDQEAVYKHLLSFKGIGRFLAYQMFIDFTYIEEFPYTEHNFVISGPGCDRGINWIFNDKDGMNTSECLFWFTRNQFNIAKENDIDWDMDKLFHFLDKKDRIYTLMDMENSGACEIDKRCRTLFEGKRPKQLYKRNEKKR